MIKCLKNNTLKTIRSTACEVMVLAFLNFKQTVPCKDHCIECIDTQSILAHPTITENNVTLAKPSHSPREQIIMATVPQSVFLTKSWSLEDVSDHSCRVYVLLLYSLTVSVCVCVSIRGCMHSNNPLNPIQPPPPTNSGFAVFKDAINFKE